MKLRLRWISYYMQKANVLTQIVFEILKFKKNMQSDWSRTQELDFSQPRGSYRFSKLVYDLKMKITLMDQIFLQNLYC